MSYSSLTALESRKEQRQQWLVRFQNKTHAVSVDFRGDDKINTKNHYDSISSIFMEGIVNHDDTGAMLQSYLLSWVSSRTGWPNNILKIRGWNYPFCEVVISGSILGGKGGFGTLLKGQSKQSGAKLTTDFGACRDLQGRRLRHVNDAMKLKKWKQQKEDGEEENNDYLFDTPSGLFNWHLMVPSWADISNKATRRLKSEVKRQWEDLEQQKKKALQEKEERQRQHRESVQQYATQASVTEALQIQTAIQEGLRRRDKKEVTVSPAFAVSKHKALETAQSSRKRRADDDNDSPALSSLFLTVSGEIIVTENEDDTPVANDNDTGSIDGKVTIQSKSDFATFIIMLPPPTTKLEHSLYYEVAWKTNNGMSQIGWAIPDQFQPCSETGDGVGDDGGSYGVDLGRKLKFHSGTETCYPGKSSTEIKFRPEDIIGCLCQFKKTETIISYSYNGKDLGVAFCIPQPSSGSNHNHYLVPAFSFDGGEILELRLLRNQMSHWPETVASSMNKTEIMDIPSFLISSPPTIKDGMDGKQITEASIYASKSCSSVTSNGIETKNSHKKDSSSPKVKEKITKEQINTKINLEEIDSVEELMNLGMDPLKVELASRQCKCGGTLEERAKRLFSLKGLSKEQYPKQARGRGFQL